MRAKILVLAIATAAAVSSQSRMVTPRYTADKKLTRPEGYREWMFVGSNLGIGYDEGQGASTFKNIYIQREAFAEYRKSGKFPDKTMLVMEVFTPGTKASPARRGQFEEKFLGVEVALKDEAAFEEKWAYFNFISGKGQLAEAKAFPKEACWNCHKEHAASDNVFVQFYPALRDK